MFVISYILIFALGAVAGSLVMLKLTKSIISQHNHKKDLVKKATPNYSNNLSYFPSYNHEFLGKNIVENKN